MFFLEASIKNLATNLEFIDKYANQNVLSSSRLAYYYTSLVAAAHYIKTLTEDELLRRSSLMEAQSPGYKATQVVYFSCEPVLGLQLCPEAELIASDIRLQGYKAVVVEDWLGKVDDFCSVVVETGNPDDFILGSLLKDRRGGIELRKANPNPNPNPNPNFHWYRTP